jgi:hypothetical protein
MGLFADKYRARTGGACAIVVVVARRWFCERLLCSQCGDIPAVSKLRRPASSHDTFIQSATPEEDSALSKQFHCILCLSSHDSQPTCLFTIHRFSPIAVYIQSSTPSSISSLDPAYSVFNLSTLSSASSSVFLPKTIILASPHPSTTALTAVNGINIVLARCNFMQVSVMSPNKCISSSVYPMILHTPSSLVHLNLLLASYPSSQ